MPRLLRLTLLLLIALCSVVAAARGVGYTLPDGGQLAMTRNHDVYLIDIDSSHILQLSKHWRLSMGSPVQWSPNGDFLAMYIINYEDIAILEMVSLELTNLTNSLFDRNDTFAWSPDSEEIVYVTSPSFDGCAVYRATRDGTEEQLLGTFDDFCVDALIWSPEENLVGASFMLTSGPRFWLIPLQEVGIEEITPNAAPDWLNGNWRVAIANLFSDDGTTEAQEGEGDAFIHDYSWAVGGKRVAFITSSLGDGQRIDRVYILLDTGCLPNCDEAIVPIVDSEGAREIELSPDGKLVAYVCAVNNSSGITTSSLCLADIENGARQEILMTWTYGEQPDGLAWRPPRPR